MLRDIRAAVLKLAKEENTPFKAHEVRNYEFKSLVGIGIKVQVTADKVRFWTVDGNNHPHEMEIALPEGGPVTIRGGDLKVLEVQGTISLLSMARVCEFNGYYRSFIDFLEQLDGAPGKAGLYRISASLSIA